MQHDKKWSNILVIFSFTPPHVTTPPTITNGLAHSWINSAQILINALELIHALQVDSLIVKPRNKMYIILLVYILVCFYARPLNIGICFVPLSLIKSLYAESA